jgi:hypothetical protein
MIEQGIVQLVQDSDAVRPLCPAGGYLNELPKGTALPSWSYRVISNPANPTLETFTGLQMLRLQVDVYGDVPTGIGVAISPKAVLQLAAAIDGALNGFSGTLNDPDATVVNSIIRTDKMDFLDDASRTHRRMLEYEVWFYDE